MRNRRMISRTISTSEKVNSVCWQSRLLFTWLILHCDDEGRMQGSPSTVKAIVLPMADCSVDLVRKWLTELRKRGLILWYTYKKEQFIQIEQWDCYQTFHGIRRISSKYPHPPVHHKRCRGTPTSVPSEVKLSKVKEVNKEKGDFSKFRNIGPKLEAGNGA